MKFDSAVACNQQTNFATGIQFSASTQIQLTAEDHLAYFCIRAMSSTNTAGFARLRVDTQAPVVTLVFEPRNSNIKAQSSENNVKWEYIRSQSSLNCDQSNAELFSPQVSGLDYYKSDQKLLYTEDNGFWLCFRATDVAGNAGYAKQQIANITLPTPGQADDKTGGNLGMIIISISLMITLIGLTAYYVVRQKRRLVIQSEKPQRQPPISKQNNPPIKEAEDQTKSVTHQSIEPLDYLKPDQDDR